MKKEIIMILFIISLVIIGHIGTQNFEKDIFNGIETDLNNLRNKMLEANQHNINIEESNKYKESLKNDIDQIINKWKEKYNKLAYFVEHDELEKIETQMILISGYIELKEYNYSVIELDKCVFLLEHVMDKDSLQLVNIF